MLQANMGVPIVCVAIPTMLIALLPIAVVESFVYWACLRRPMNDAFWGAVKANVISTLYGLPMVWLPFLGVQIAIGGGEAWPMETRLQRIEAATLQAAWLVPYPDHINWMIPTASLLFLTPFYLGSIAVEYLLLAARWPSVARKPLLLSVVVANAASYSLLGVWYGIQLWLAVKERMP